MNDILKSLKFLLAAKANMDFVYARNSYSQEGEDLIIDKIFKDQNTGFYIDVGAYHPYRLSNTYLLYKRGWKGINIDPSSGAKELFRVARSRDKFIQCGVSNKNKILTYYTFKNGALNTTSKSRMEIVVSSGQSELIQSNITQAKKLSSILRSQKVIDFLNIDTEGNELSVLRSNDWSGATPKVVAVENLTNREKVNKFMKSKNYNKIAQTILTGIYLKNL